MGAAWILDMVLGTTIVATAWAAMALLVQRGPAALRHLVWRITVSAFVAVPAIAGIIGCFGVRRVEVTVPVLTTHAAAVNPTQVIAVGSAYPDDAASAAARLEARPASATGAAQFSAPLIAFLAWLLGSLVSVGALGGQVLALNRLRSSGSGISAPELVHCVETWRSKIGLRQAPRLAVSSSVVVPTVLGWRRPLILLPAELPTDDECLGACLLHELAHVQRHDVPWQAFSRAVQVLWWWHPVLWMAGRELRETAEQACDDWAVELTGQKKGYAGFLVSCAEYAANKSDVLCQVRGQHLVARIERLLSRSYVSAPRLRRWVSACLTAVGVTAVTWGASLHFCPAGQTIPHSAPGAAPAAAMLTAQRQAASRTRGAVPGQAVSPDASATQSVARKPLAAPQMLTPARAAAGGDQGGAVGGRNHGEGKLTAPVSMRWSEVDGADHYVVSVTSLWGPPRTRSVEAKHDPVQLGEGDLKPGGYVWEVKAYDAAGKSLGPVRQTEPDTSFAVADPQAPPHNGKTVLIDLRHCAGSVEWWGRDNHAQYMTKELLEQAGFQVTVNDEDLLIGERLRGTNLVICNYYWAGWPHFEPYVDSELRGIKDYIEHGGCLLVVGCDRKDETQGGQMAPAANPLLAQFGCAFDLTGTPDGQVQSAVPVSSQSVVPQAPPLPLQLPLVVRGDHAQTILATGDLSFVKAERVGQGKVVVAGVGMAFLDCYLRASTSRDSRYVRLFYDVIRYLTDVDCEQSSRPEFVHGLLGSS
jgi:beta-lactamase regulating signal transducer with metallopeptidase domain